MFPFLQQLTSPEPVPNKHRSVHTGKRILFDVSLRVWHVASRDVLSECSPVFSSVLVDPGYCRRLNDGENQLELYLRASTMR